MEEQGDFGRRKVWRTETRMEDGSCERERRKTRKSESETRAGKLKSGGAKRRRRLLPPSKRQDMRSRKRSCFLLVPPSVGSSAARNPSLATVVSFTPTEIIVIGVP